MRVGGDKREPLDGRGVLQEEGGSRRKAKERLRSKRWGDGVRRRGGKAR